MLSTHSFELWPCPVVVGLLFLKARRDLFQTRGYTATVELCSKFERGVDLLATGKTQALHSLLGARFALSCPAESRLWRKAFSDNIQDRNMLSSVQLFPKL